MNEVWQRYYDILKYILVILFIVVLGLSAVNLFLEYRYHAELLQKPCELCARLNQGQSSCIQGCFTQRDNLPALDLPPIKITTEYK